MRRSTFPSIKPFNRSGLLVGATACLAALTLPSPGGSQTAPSLNMYGATGLIDMPSGEAQPDGQVSATTSYFGASSRTTLTFQISPRISASFRFLGIRNLEASTGPDPFVTYYDRSFDFRFRLLEETASLPALTLGIQDLAGTGVLSSEYLAATKSITPEFKVTAGLGWGRLGSKGSIGAPFGARPKLDFGSGGDFNAGQWFRGPAAPFGGVEWKISDAWTLKGEYSSDAYITETQTRPLFDRKSSFNFGVEYQPSDYYRLGAYYMYGSEIGISGQLFFNPKRSPAGGVSGPAPNPINPRPDRARNPGDWATEWVAQDGAAEILRDNLAERLKQDRISVESLSFTATTAQVRIQSAALDSNAQAIGRTARALSNVMPASVERFEIIPLAAGMEASKVVVLRSDLEALEFAPDMINQMRAKAEISDASGVMPRLATDPDLYPVFAWSLAPYTRFRYFDLNEPFKADVGLRAKASLEIAPGLMLSGSVTQRLAGNLDDKPVIPSRARLHPVRSAVYYYGAEGDTTLERLTLNWNAKLSPTVYSRVTVGYLEEMYGGVSTEVLWKPVGSRFALGAELNYVKQRNPDGGFSFKLPASMYETKSNPASGPSSYSIATGHLSVYYAFGDGYLGQLDVGRYLAGDVGATLSLDREFANGWKIGGFLTKTNVSSSDFGSGSFDKGIRVTLPFAWLLGKPTQTKAETTLRPFGRDGGGRLDVEGRLYDTVRKYHENDLNSEFGRFWK